MAEPFSPNCTKCQAGSYQTAVGMANRSACPAGRFQTGEGMATNSSCALCGRGNYSFTLGATASSACVACPNASTSSLGYQCR